MTRLLPQSKLVPAIADWLCWLPLSILLLGSYQTLTYWLIRKRAFRQSAVNEVPQTSFTVIPTALLGFLAVPGGLPIGYIVDWVGGNLMGLRQLFGTAFEAGTISTQGVTKSALHYQDMPKYGALPVILDGASLSILVMPLNSFFFGSAASLFALTRQVPAGSPSLISDAISQVTRGEAIKTCSRR
jgi:hypothetical protein